MGVGLRWWDGRASVYLLPRRWALTWGGSLLFPILAPTRWTWPPSCSTEWTWWCWTCPAPRCPLRGPGVSLRGPVTAVGRWWSLGERGQVLSWSSTHECPDAQDWGAVTAGYGPVRCRCGCRAGGRPCGPEGCAWCCAPTAKAVEGPLCSGMPAARVG